MLRGMRLDHLLSLGFWPKYCMMIITVGCSITIQAKFYQIFPIKKALKRQENYTCLYIYIIYKTCILKKE